MSTTRTYRLLCPIARALDRVGDRWALLILRDLHAGPARFSDLQQGLPGVASNMLSARLRELRKAGLIRRRKAEFGASVYELTEAGSNTHEPLAALARFGMGLPPDRDTRRPGNLRMLALPLRAALRDVVDPARDWQVTLLIGGEPFDVRARAGEVSVRYGEGTDPQAVIETSYEPIIGMADTGMPLQEFSSKWFRVREGDPVAAQQVLDLLARAFS